MKNTKEVPWGDVVTNIQANILKGLARYKFLTISQMLKLDVGTAHRQYCWKQAASLRDRRKPLVVANNYSTPQPRKGKVESLYYLTKEGKKSLMHDLMIPEEEIRMPIGKTVAYEDYVHRTNTIDYQIALDTWSRENDIEVSKFDTYFDKIGNNRTTKNMKSATRISLSETKSMIPDAVYTLKNSSGESKLHLFEMHNGKDSNRAVKQIHVHAQAMQFKCPHKKYGLDETTSYKVIYLFKHRSIMESVIERMKKDPSFAVIHKYFLCNSIEVIEDAEFFNSWVNLYGDPAILHEA